MKVKLTVPTSLSEIKLKDYVRFMNVVKGSNDAEFINQIATDFKTNDNYNFKKLVTKTVSKCIEDEYEN